MTGLKTFYTLLPVNQDRRLSGIVHRGVGNAEPARFAYTYGADQGIATWSQTQIGVNPGRQWAMTNDADGQMETVLETPLIGPVTNPQKVWRYHYDASGNRTLAQENQSVRTAKFNDLNQMTDLVVGGEMWFRGQVNEPANVVIGGKTARVFRDGRFEAMLNLGAGVHDVMVEATDQAGNVKQETWRVDNGPHSIPRSMSYDRDGNLLSDGKRRYAWDARHCMTEVSMGTDTWAFEYDGGRHRIREKKNSVVMREWVWSGTEMIEERLTDGRKRRFWSGGIELLDSANVQTGKRYLLRDHLGSARVVVDGEGAVTASYDYTPWGERTKLSGVEEWNTGYTGHWWHESGLSLTLYRVYDPELGRWLSRDPIGERGGANLYAYVGNGPIGATDPLGLDAGLYIPAEIVTMPGFFEGYAKHTTPVAITVTALMSGGLIYEVLSPTAIVAAGGSTRYLKSTRDALQKVFKDGYNPRHLKDVPKEELKAACEAMKKGLDKLKANPKNPANQIEDFERRVKTLEGLLKKTQGQ